MGEIYRHTETCVCVCVCYFLFTFRALSQAEHIEVEGVR